MSDQGKLPMVNLYDAGGKLEALSLSHRERQILGMRDAGWSVEEIAEHFARFNVSVERVRQIEAGARRFLEGRHGR